MGINVEEMDVVDSEKWFGELCRPVVEFDRNFNRIVEMVLIMVPDESESCCPVHWLFVPGVVEVVAIWESVKT